ncbi:hypothetical protein ACQKJG_18495 [Priestia megaterium]|uniref:hypothetical protein n=1 Tax=Priestia megaterium TaxID=1404 RepID=UPI003D0439EF
MKNKKMMYVIIGGLVVLIGLAAVFSYTKNQMLKEDVSVVKNEDLPISKEDAEYYSFYEDQTEKLEQLHNELESIDNDLKNNISTNVANYDGIERKMLTEINAILENDYEPEAEEVQELKTNMITFANAYSDYLSAERATIEYNSSSNQQELTNREDELEDARSDMDSIANDVDWKYDLIKWEE